ncbi:MAG: hypothetical protein ACI9H6_000628 [Patiriisocius sp.]|jgi:hypothetical protein
MKRTFLALTVVAILGTSYTWPNPEEQSNFGMGVLVIGYLDGNTRSVSLEKDSGGMWSSLDSIVFAEKAHLQNRILNSSMEDLITGEAYIKMTNSDDGVLRGEIVRRN